MSGRRSFDPQHPAEIAELYARHLPRAVIVDAADPALLQRIAELARDLRPVSD